MHFRTGIVLFDINCSITPISHLKGCILGSWEGRITTEAINVDNKANFRYPEDYSFRLMEASICCATAKAGTQLTIFA
jgi:hypothetical protein